MSPKSLGRIALAVFRESVRERVLYNLVGFALLVIGASYLIGQMTAGQDVKIIKDLGLSAMSIFGLFIAIFIGIGLVSKEIERRSIYSLIAKPVRRSELVVGKFLGLALTVAINLAVMTAVWYLVLATCRGGDRAALRRAGRRRPPIRGCWWRCTCIFVQLMLVIALALFFSTFAEPLWATVFTFGLYVAGHFSADLKHFDVVVGDSPVRYVDDRPVLPAAEHGDVRRQERRRARAAGAVRLRPGAATAYGACYIAGPGRRGGLIFSRRDFK